VIFVDSNISMYLVGGARARKVDAERVLDGQRDPRGRAIRPSHR